MKSKKILMIDGASSGKQLAMMFIKNGHQVYHMTSGSEENYNIPDSSKNSYVAEMTDGVDYLECFHYDTTKTVEENANPLYSYGFDAIIPGTESGVWVAEAIAKQLQLPGNDPATFSKRRDKYFMQKALKDAGIRSIDALLTSSCQEALEFFRGLPNGKMIIKPCSSAGSEGVYLCRNEQEVEHYFSESIGKKDFYGNANEQLLLQEYISGIEYVADSVSCKGQHLLTDAHVYDKINTDGDSGSFVYDRMTLIDEISDCSIEYVNKVLDAVGIENGASHLEFKIDERGPVLIEVGARIVGASFIQYITEALGYDLPELILAAYSGSSDFEQWYNKIHGNYKIEKNTTIKFLISYCDGEVRETPALENLSRLKTFRDVDLEKVKVNGKLMRTKDLITAPGLVYLVGSKEDVDADCLTINDWEKNHLEKLFKLEVCK